MCNLKSIFLSFSSLTLTKPNWIHLRLIKLENWDYSSQYKCVSPLLVCVCVCCTHSLVETALTCGGLRPGVCWAMAGRDDSSLSEVRVNKVSVFIPMMREPSCCSWPGAVSWAEGGRREGQGAKLREQLYTKLTWCCAYKITHRATWRHLVYNYGSLKHIQNDW